MPNGEPLYISYVEVFGDDVSGNRSKAWNRHWNVYVSHRNLPRTIASNEFHVHFFSTSQDVPIYEQLNEVKRAIEETHEHPIRVYDAAAKRMVRIRLAMLNFAADNPMASEVSNHIGGQGNFPCRKCLVGGSRHYKETDGYESLFYPGQPRQLSQSWDSVLKEAAGLACRESAATLQSMQRDTGVKARFSDETIPKLLRWSDSLGIEDGTEKRAVVMSFVEENAGSILPATLCMKGFDPIVDTPVEVLHTVLLGYVKYLWIDTFQTLTASKNLETFATRLKATEMPGLSIPQLQPSYIIRYGNSLTGQHFRQLIQTAPFSLPGLVDDATFSLWKEAAKLTALIWFTRVIDRDEYISMLEIQTARVLDGFAKLKPKRIIDKAKLHLLVHLGEDVKRFGPLVGASTERFESFNAVFRGSSVYSNRQNPSRDIATDQAGCGWMKQLLADGFIEASPGQWAQPGEALRRLLESKVLRDACSYNPERMYDSPKAGSCRAYGKPVGISTTAAAEVPTLGNVGVALEQLVYRCASVVSSNGDCCTKGSFVFFDYEGGYHSGRIVELLSCDGNSSNAIVLDIYEVLPEKDDVYELPVLRSLETRVTISPQLLRFDFNAQPATVGSYWLMNTFSFHNAHLLYDALPHELLRPIQIARRDRAALHKLLAQRIQASRPTGRKRRAADMEAHPVADSAPASPGVGTQLASQW